MKLRTLFSLFIIAAFEILTAFALKANLRQLAQQHHAASAQQVQQFHKSNPMFTGNHYQELVRNLASTLQSRALNAGKYGKSKKSYSQNQGSQRHQQLPAQQKLRSFKNTQSDGASYPGHKLKSLNGHMPAQQMAPSHHGQINEMTGQKTNKLRINPALKERLLKNDPPMTMSTKPLSKGMPPSKDGANSDSSSPMGFGARTKSRLEMFSNMQKMGTTGGGATGASASGSGRSLRRQNLVPKREQELRTLGSTGRRNKPQYDDEVEEEDEYVDPDQSIDRIVFPAGNKPQAMRTLERKNSATKTDISNGSNKINEVVKTTVTETDTKTQEADENPNKEHIFIPRKIYRPRPSKKTNQTESTATSSMTKLPNEVVVNPVVESNTTANVTAKITTPETKSASVLTQAIEETKSNQTIATDKVEEAKQETVTELKAQKPAETETKESANEGIIPLRASRIMTPIIDQFISNVDESAVEELQAPVAELQAPVAELQAPVAELQAPVPEETPLTAESEKEVRLLPINLQNLEGQLAVETPLVQQEQAQPIAQNLAIIQESPQEAVAVAPVAAELMQPQDVLPITNEYMQPAAILPVQEQLSAVQQDQIPVIAQQAPLSLEALVEQQQPTVTL